MNALLTGLIVVVVVVVLVLALALRIVKQYEQGVLFRFGRVVGVRQPGLRVIIPLVDVLHRVSMRIVTMPSQSQGIITRDNVSVEVSAVAYFQVVEPTRSVVAIENVYARSTRSPRRRCERRYASTPWTRRCPTPTASTPRSASSSTSRPSSGGCRSPWSSSRTSSCSTA